MDALGRALARVVNLGAVLLVLWIIGSFAAAFMGSFR